MITERQEKILNSLIKEYINRAEPISSELLKKRCSLGVSPATIRNDLQELTEEGYITQPHTSAGRVPTEKGYKFFIEITFSGKLDKFPEFILKEVEEAKQKIEKELELAKELTKSLEQIHTSLNFNRIEEEMLFDVLKIVVPSRTTYKKNIDLIKELIKKLGAF
ncbi:MAG: DeoR family transcriptional regulator [Patescibacteria group bacterium]